MSEDAPTEKKKKGPSCGCLILGAILLVLFLGTFLGPIAGPVRPPRESAAMQTCRQIGLGMFAYANDHGGKYPDGQSSTEVFQKLLDEGYVTDPSIFYVPAMPGKRKPEPDAKLKPENVGWDVTGGVDRSTSDFIPMVFLTGYKVTYAPGTAAVYIDRSFSAPTRTWSEWWAGMPDPITYDGIAVAFKDNSAKFMILKDSSGTERSVPEFVSKDFVPDGKTYRQLTPDGVAP